MEVGATLGSSGGVAIRFRSRPGRDKSIWLQHASPHQPTRQLCQEAPGTRQLVPKERPALCAFSLVQAAQQSDLVRRALAIEQSDPAAVFHVIDSPLGQADGDGVGDRHRQVFGTPTPRTPGLVPQVSVQPAPTQRSAGGTRLGTVDVISASRTPPMESLRVSTKTGQLQLERKGSLGV